MPRRTRFTLALLAVVVVGFGAPLVHGYLVAREAKQDPDRLEALLARQLEKEPGSVPTREWLIRFMTMLPEDRSYPVLLQYARDPRPGVRFVVVDWLRRYYTHRPQTALEVAHYVNDPREVALYRWSIFDLSPGLKTSPITQPGWETLQRQLGLFPDPAGMYERRVNFNYVFFDEAAK